ncbi:hypothetical protein QBC45DRAFT_13424 [Copromyces sp. CBS 386.78]|nr:hypothetical protein QBC45DRAFT_13424 [Copromyces sp. CBS 386.78]
MAAPDNPIEPPGSGPDAGDQLKSWLRSLAPTKVDLVGDFAGKERFAIHGEALLAHCLHTMKVDFDYGFQILHAIHAVEALLLRLRDRGCNFHVLWFDREYQLSIPTETPAEVAYKYQLTRKILIQHFAHAQTGKQPVFSFVFPSLDSDFFTQYLEEHHPGLFLGSDGTTPWWTGGPELLTPLHSLYRISSAGYHVACVEHLEFKASKVFLPIASPRGVQRSLNGDAPTPDTSPVEDNIGDRLAVLIKEHNLTAREIISLYSLAHVLGQYAPDADEANDVGQQVTALLLQVVFLRQCSITGRNFEPRGTGLELGSAANSFVCSLSEPAQRILGSWSSGPFADSAWDAFDLFDGRLYLALLRSVDNMHLPSALQEELIQLGGLLEHLCGYNVTAMWPANLTDTDGGEPGLKNADRQPNQSAPSFPVLPFSHPVLDEFLTSVHLRTEAVTSPPVNHKVHKELTHWHNKKPIDPKQPPKALDFKARRRNQRFMADIIAYSASLTGVSGKIIEPETVVVRSAVEQSKPASKQPANKGKKLPVNPKKPLQKSGKQKALEEAELRRAAKFQDKSPAIITFWKERCQEFSKEPSLVKRYLRVQKYLLGLSPVHLSVIGSEVSLYLCNVLRQTQARYNPATITHSSVLAMLWSQIQETARLTMTEEVHTLVTRLLQSFKLPVDRLSAPLPKRKMPFEFLDVEKNADLLPPGKSSLEFQLESCGPYFDRSFDSAPDPRVSFEPDAWQRKVLDAIDEDKSLLVVAPTSAGKTFISFYAMRKILEANNDDVLVYIAPTKALVNQIAAEIQARFSKRYDQDAKSVWAIHTRDYRINNVKGCQILVTVPDILQIILLSPSNATGPTSFARRIKRIIFDEVHCIGQSEDGLVWEQLLLLAPCPIIALSATVGNPLEFRDWLRNAQKAKGHDLEMVVHTSRYSDLRKFIHDPSPGTYEFTGFEPVERLPFPGLDSDCESPLPFLFLHPVAGIIDRSRDTLNDASLEPRDCIELWRHMTKYQNGQYQVPKSLDPENVLPSLVKKSDITKWESALKDVLASWMLDPNSPFEELRSNFRGERFARLSSTYGQFESGDLPPSQSGAVVSRRSVFSLVTDLRTHGALPAILFNYDRVGCETILQGLNNTLEAAEAAYKQSNPEWLKKLEAFEEWKKYREAAKLKEAKMKETKKSRSRNDDDDGATKGDRARDEANRELSVWDSFDPAAPLPQFGFADNTKLTQQELNARLEPLTWKADIVRPWILAALYRGIGVHHAGMNRQYRQIVEVLFRKGFLTVVVATGTLAMGLNMPCKTVVFTGDSVFLSALNYRQASGRAGRRGFDILGNVIFHDIHPHRVLEIMSAKLPDLRGQFPTSVSLILRLFTLLDGTDNSEFAVNAVNSLLTQSRLYLGGPDAKMSIAHHLRFSIDYLRRQHLLSEHGVPLNFAGLVGHLYYTENAVFAFHSLLNDGYFYDLCSSNRSQQEIILELMLVLSHLFCRQACVQYKDKKFLKRLHRSPSVGILPDLPQKASELLERHNQQTLSVFQNYVSSYVDQHLAGTPDNCLPLTDYKVGTVQNQPMLDLSTILPASDSPRTPTVVRSPFSALSGLTDEFGSIHELCETVRAGVFLEESAVPYIPIAPKETNGVPLNAYLYDFFKHGDMEALKEFNMIKGGDVWYFLKDFSLILSSILTSFANFLDLPTADGEFAFEEEDEMAEDEGPPLSGDEEDGKKNDVSSAPAPPQKEQQKTKAKKKVVADSWDDEESDEDTDDDTETANHGSSGPQAPSWADDDGQNLTKIFKTFLALRTEFEEKFRKTFA